MYMKNVNCTNLWGVCLGCGERSKNESLNHFTQRFIESLNFLMNNAFLILKKKKRKET